MQQGFLGRRPPVRVQYPGAVRSAPQRAKERMTLTQASIHRTTRSWAFPKLADDEHVQARSVVIASGARYRRRDIRNLAAFEATSVHYWASPLEAKLCAGQENREKPQASHGTTQRVDGTKRLPRVMIVQLPTWRNERIEPIAVRETLSAHCIKPCEGELSMKHANSTRQPITDFDQLRRTILKSAAALVAAPSLSAIALAVIPNSQTPLLPIRPKETAR